MRQRRSVLFPAAVALFAATALAACDGGAPPAPPPPEVGVVKLAAQPVTLTSELPGRTTPFAVSEVRPQVNGIVKARLFTEGSEVKAGQVLYQIDPAPYEAAYQSARAALASASASVTSTKAKAERYAHLRSSNAISRQDYDDAQAAYLQAQANAAQQNALLKAAKINLDHTKLAAPISGVIGRSTVTQGALVTADQPTALATIQQLDPIYVDITQSSVQLLRLKQQAAKGLLDADAPVTAKATLLLEDGTRYAQEGRLQFSEVTVDQNTGAVTLRALFPNPGKLLLPGMFVRAQISEGVNTKGILVPQQGVQYNEKGQPFGFVVGKQNKAQQRMLTISRSMGNKWLVTSGLKAGDRLITEGLQKVQPDIAVHPVPAGSPPGGGQAGAAKPPG